MAKLHITQDDHDYWMLSLEADDGTLSLVAHQFAAPDKLIEMAKELVEEGRVNAAIVVDPPRSRARAATAASEGYTKPEPRKAGE
jgi:hypothetical protein